jgi:hypothetical protein
MRTLLFFLNDQALSHLYGLTTSTPYHEIYSSAQAATFFLHREVPNFINDHSQATHMMSHKKEEQTAHYTKQQRGDLIVIVNKKKQI